MNVCVRVHKEIVTVCRLANCPKSESFRNLTADASLPKLVELKDTRYTACGRAGPGPGTVGSGRSELCAKSQGPDHVHRSPLKAQEKYHELLHIAIVRCGLYIGGSCYECQANTEKKGVSNSQVNCNCFGGLQTA